MGLKLRYLKSYKLYLYVYLSLLVGLSVSFISTFIFVKLLNICKKIWLYIVEMNLQSRDLANSHLAISQFRELGSRDLAVSRTRISRSRSLANSHLAISQSRELSSRDLAISQSRDLSVRDLAVSQSQL